MKTLVWAGFFIGSAVGGFIPGIWGDSMFSLSSIMLSAAGGIIGIFAGYHIGRNIGV